jgi:hypothetical protein
MEMSERAVHINNLIALKDFCNNNGVFTLASNIEQSLDYAISSLKTDLKYDLMYEGEEIFTKADMVTMLEELDLQIDESAAYNLEVAKVQRLIRDKINALRGGE